MADFRSDGELQWPPHLAKYRPADGWESKLDWEIARVHWARSQGFKNFKMLPLIQRMMSGAVGTEPNKKGSNQ
jgi:hypothetical protein